jgi:beta-phosphoglucomutase-like phosphatase (HAD superfamily)
MAMRDEVHAVIFDIDGTLLDSFEDDAILYFEAIRQVMGQVGIREAWEHYPCVSELEYLSALRLRPDVQIASRTSAAQPGTRADLTFV